MKVVVLGDRLNKQPYKRHSVVCVLKPKFEVFVEKKILEVLKSYFSVYLNILRLILILLSENNHSLQVSLK